MKKRIIAMLLSICLMFSLLPLGVVAVDESYGISEDGTVEETEAPEVTEAPEATEDPAATDPEETEPEETEPEETEPEDDEPTVYEQMMAAETADDVYTILLADQQAAAVLTAEEINALIAKVEALPADDSKEELLETLEVLSSGFDTDEGSDKSDNNAAVLIEEPYTPVLMRKVLEDSDRYSIKPFNVNLFNYDPTTFNTSLGSKLGEGNHFTFVGYETGVDSNGGINDSTATYAKQGIVENQLQNGLPVFNRSYVDKGLENAAYFFSTDAAYDLTGKTNHANVDFEFVYDNQTGFYEYKSSANHAQYNTVTNKIELYADTLSTSNAKTVKLDLNNARDSNALASFTHENGVVSGTTTVNNSRMDPYFYIDVDNIPGNQINTIYMTVKVPTDAGPTQAKVYFTTTATGVAEANCFKVNYTPTGDWQTIALIPSGDALKVWDAGVITSLRIDPLDNVDSSGGANGSATNVSGTVAASHSISVKDLILYGGSGTYSSSVAHATNGGFYPFSDIANSYESYSEFNYAAWAEHMSNSSEVQKFASRSIGSPSPTNLTDNLAYGVVMEFDFYIPVSPDNELIYWFTGDDDLWVFVDDTLALDLGGGHGAINGSINFSKGKASVASAVQISGYDSNEGNAKKVETELANSLYAPGKHTMKVFYLERCGSVSNCQMKFNLPLVPQGSVYVNKTVEEDTGRDLTVLQKEEFTFTISTEYGGEGKPEKYSYTHVALDGTATQKETSGNFVLKHGESAIFMIDENYDVTVSETATNEIPGYTYMGTTLNGESGVTATKHTVKNTACEFNFVNKYKELEATYKYIPVNPVGCPDNVKGTVKLNQNGSVATHASTGVSETVGQAIGVPVGSTAEGTIAVKFVGWYSDAECTNLLTNNAASYVPGADEDHLYTGGTYYAKFEYMYGNLTITKSGIESADHHVKTSATEEEFQSVIFNVYGTSNSGVAIDMDVVVHIKNDGTGSVTIKDIPVGSYTVTEKENWSWRYDPEASFQTAVVADEETTTSAFENNRDKTKWLNGDNYTTNIFDGSSVSQKTGFAN